MRGEDVDLDVGMTAAEFAEVISWSAFAKVRGSPAVATRALEAVA